VAIQSEKRRSLKKRMILRIAALLLFLILFVFVYFPYSQGREAMDSLTKRARILNEMIAASLVAAVEFNDLQTMQNIINNVKVDSDLSFVTVISADKKTLVSINEGNIPKDMTKVQVKDTDIEYTEKIIISYTPVKSNTGNVIATTIMGFSLASIEQFKMINRLVTLVICLVMFVIGLWYTFIFSNQIVNPIVRISSMLKDVAEGEGDLTKKINIEGDDEIFELASWFNIFIGKIKGMITQVKDVSGNILDSSNNVNIAVKNIAEGMAQQAMSFDQITKTVQDIAGNSERANSIAINTKDETTIAQEAMKRNIESVTKIKESSGKIVDSVDFITDIADQTNLLALNAAIEAARAGEHGKGFAVVADEVRKLAEKSANSVTVISDIVRTSNTQIDDGVKYSVDAGKSMNEIITKIDHIAQALESISQATTEHAASMEENTALINNTSTRAQEIMTISDSMKDKSSKLNEMVSRFKT
jgi:methyl-accepting chemotaxis protein